MPRQAVAKTFKLFIDGEFVRSESGRTERRVAENGKFLANCASASRKDLRDAVRSSRAAQELWRRRSGYNKGQILYRLAEMLEARAEDFVRLIMDETGLNRTEATKEIQIATDRLVYFCGWADKFTAIHGSVNPVAGSYFDFSFPEPTGIVVVFAPESSPLVGMVTLVSSVIVTGNSCVLAASQRSPLTQLLFAEVLATSDVPKGVVNVLSGDTATLAKHSAAHMDVNAIAYSGGDPTIETIVRTESVCNLKRVAIGPKRTRAQWQSERSLGPEWMEEFVETKTVWHPVGL